MTRQLPWFKMFAAGFLADALALSNEATGLHIRLLCLFWHQGPIPNDPAWIRSRCGSHSDAALDEVLALWEERDGCFVFASLEAERDALPGLQEARREAGVKGGRASGKARKQRSKQVLRGVLQKNEASTEATVEPDQIRSEEIRPDQKRAEESRETLAAQARPRRTPDGAHAAFIAWFCEAWQERRLGVVYAVQGAKDGAAVSWILKQQGGAEEARRRAVRMLESEDAWTAQHASLSLLRSRWNDFALEFKKTAQTRREATDAAFRELAARHTEGGRNGQHA